jgi:hypothetical protein
MILFAYLSLRLNLFTSVPLFLGQYTFLSLPFYCPVLSCQTANVFYGRLFLSFRPFRSHLYFQSDKQLNLSDIRREIRQSTHSVGYKFSEAHRVVLGGSLKPMPQLPLANPPV